MAERIAASLAVLRDQVNRASPNRSKISDGWLGDRAHASRKSDHNSDPRGIVHALDITHDPAHGVDAGKLAEAIRRSNDPRVKYIISNRRIASAPGLKWVKYTGANPHDKHCHISVKSGSIEDDKSPWAITFDASKVDVLPSLDGIMQPLLKVGSKFDNAVRELQKLLKFAAADIDGKFGKMTEDAVKKFQKANGLTADGMVGPYTWEKLKSKPKGVRRKR